MAYDIRKTVLMRKREYEDFVILNLTDIQLNDLLDLAGRRRFTVKTIKELIKRVKPDLITMTGDQFWARFTKRSVREFIRFFDSFRIPWAPIHGNHDGEGSAKIPWIVQRYKKSRYCLFHEGPSDIGGCGNYVINIMKDGLIFHSLILMDTGGFKLFDDADASDRLISYDLNDKFELKKSEEGDFKVRKVGENYACLTPRQVDWYEEMIKGAEQYNVKRGGNMPQSTLFIHIPLPEYYTAYVDYLLGGKDKSYGFFGAMRENVCCSKRNSGMFERIVRLGSTKNVLAGHDHTNDYSVMFEGVRLTYALKTGDRCYSADGINGGTVITINNDGNAVVRHEYISFKK